MTRIVIHTAMAFCVFLTLSFILLPSSLALKEPSPVTTSSSIQKARRIRLKQFSKQQYQPNDVAVPKYTYSAAPKKRRKRALDRVIDKLFDDADTNKDGTIEFIEVYELVLKLLIKVNRQAPIPAPSREMVHIMFSNVDTNFNGKLDVEEFRLLLWMLVNRHSTRIVIYKFFRAAVAPICAIQVVNKLKGNKFLLSLLDNMALSEQIRTTLTQVQVWQAIITVIFVMTFGTLAIGISTALMDWKEAAINKARNNKLEKANEV